MNFFKYMDYSGSE